MSVADELERLQALRDKGALSDSEFANAKARVLGDASTSPAPSDQDTFLRKLRRSSSDSVIGGVCGGLGQHTGMPSWAWRVIFCLSVLYMGFGLLIYLALWVFIPPAPQGS